MITENINLAQYRIQDALGKRQAKTELSQQVKLVAVTKNQTADKIIEVIDAGITAIGENRVQEAQEKYAYLQKWNLEWHLIGHLQTNKVKQAVSLFDFIHSVDSERLAVALDKAAASAGKIQKVLMQVNIAEEESKFGIPLPEFWTLAKFISQQKNLQLCGVMIIAPYFAVQEDTRPIFAKAYELFSQLKKENWSNTSIEWLSMGMTNDYEVAVQEGSNLVRIGTGIFGERHY